MDPRKFIVAVLAIILLCVMVFRVAAAGESTEAMARATTVSETDAATVAATAGTKGRKMSAFSDNPDITSYSQNPYAFDWSSLAKDEMPEGFILPAIAIDGGPVNLKLPVKGALLMSSDTGEVLYEQNRDEILPIASITKIMTMLLLFDEIDAGRATLTDKVKVSEHAAKMGGSQIWLDPTETFTVEELLKAVCVSSANDAAVALAEHIAGSEPVFVEMMNRRAKQLNMTDTFFVNACGLDAPGHLSSAYDVALMARAIMRHEELIKYTTIWTDTLRDGQTMLVNTNKLIRSYSGITGLKTGTTGAAGICICATATRDDMSLIAVVLGAEDSDSRFTAARTLLDFGFANFRLAKIPDLSIYPGEIKIQRGELSAAPLTYMLPKKMLVQKTGEAKLTATVNVPKTISAPVPAGMQIGTITLFSGEIMVGEYPIILELEIKKITFRSAFKRFAKACLIF